MYRFSPKYICLHSLKLWIIYLEKEIVYTTVSTEDNHMKTNNIPFICPLISCSYQNVLEFRLT